jgi:NDP-sugar pyrophosphorylase family protein
VRVDAAATLERSILWNGATIGARANLRDTIVGTGYVVQPESVLDDALVALEASS